MWLKRRKEPSKIQTVASTKLKNKLEFIQSKWVNCMQCLESKCSIKQKKLAVVVFCFLFAGSSLAILVETIVKPIQNNQVVNSHDSNMPYLPKQQFITLNQSDSFNLKVLRKQLDSLALTPNGIEQIKQFEERYPGVLNQLRSFK